MLVVPPTAQKRAEIDRVIAKVTRKAKHHNEIVQSVRKVWMPYHRIWISCTDIRTSRPARVVTALNALFCSSTRTEPELLQLFRPRHLEKPLKEMDAEPSEVVLPYPEADLNTILGKLVKMRAEAQDQLVQMKRQLANGYRKMQWQYLFLPRSTHSLQREEQTSARVAELQSRSFAVDICLNLADSLVPQNVGEHDVIYVPMAVVHVKEGENESSRHILIDLTTGRLDAALTGLCEANEDFKSRLATALRP